MRVAEQGSMQDCRCMVALPRCAAPGCRTHSERILQRPRTSKAGGCCGRAEVGWLRLLLPWPIDHVGAARLRSPETLPGASGRRHRPRHRIRLDDYRCARARVSVRSPGLPVSLSAPLRVCGASCQRSSLPVREQVASPPLRTPKTTRPRWVRAYAPSLGRCFPLACAAVC